MDDPTEQALELEGLAVTDGLHTIASDAQRACDLAMEGIVKDGLPPPKHKFLQIRLEELEREIRLQIEQRRLSAERFPQLLEGKHLEDLRRVLHQRIEERCHRLRSLTQDQSKVPSRTDPRRDEASRLKEITDGLLKQLQLAPRLKAGAAEESVVFISCGQYSEEEISLGKAVERLVEEMTGVTAYFAENQNSLEALSENIFHSLKRAAGFIAIMHHRGTVTAPHGKTHIRGSIWIEQEIAIAAFLTSSGQSFPVIVYQKADENGDSIKREGVRDQLRLDPVTFYNADDVLRDLRLRIETGKFAPRKSGGQTRSVKEEARYNKAKAVLEKHGEPALIVLRHLQDVGEYGSGSVYGDPEPPGITGSKMREMLRLLQQEGLVAEQVIESPQYRQVFRIAPGMKAVLDELV